jgi:transposase-like protein
MARASITPEQKTRISADLLTGASVNETARKHHVSPATVSRIKAEFAPETLKQIETEKRAEIGDLLLILVESNVHAMKRISEAVSESKNINAENLSAVAEIYRTLSDTTLSILEAASAAGLDADPAGTDSRTAAG